MVVVCPRVALPVMVDGHGGLVEQGSRGQRNIET
jgi:hypothetical protein